MTEISNQSRLNAYTLTYKVEGYTNPNWTYAIRFSGPQNHQPVVQTWIDPHHFTLGYHHVAYPVGNQLSVRVWQLAGENHMAGSLGFADRTIHLGHPGNGARFTIVLKADPWFPGDVAEISIREGE